MIKKLYLGFVFMLLMLASLSTVSLEAATPVGTVFNFDFNTTVGMNPPVVTDLGPKTYGSEVIVDPGTIADHEFVTYIVNGKVESSLPASNTFLVTSDLTVTALYKPTGTISVAFMDSDLEVMDVQYITSGASATPPNIEGYTKPGYVVNSGEPWSGSYTAVTEDTILWVQYSTTVATGPFTVSVTNGSADQANYAYDEVAMVTASGTGNFQHWEKDGMIVSINPSYSFTVAEDTDITAVFDAVEVSPDPDTLFINLMPYSGLVLDSSTWVGQFNVPDGNEMIEYGILAADLQGGITFDTPGVQKIRSDKYNSVTNEFVRSLADASYGSKTIRGYMVTTNGVSETITYSGMPYYYPIYASDLIISEIIEEGANKAIEIYNGTGEAVDLSTYSLELYSNDTLTVGGSVTLSGTLADRDVYIIFNSGSDTAISSIGDLSNNGVANFNGNDSVVLKNDGSIIDNVGQIGDAGYFCDDATLVRKISVSSGDSVADDAFDKTIEWTVYPENTYSYLGSHDMGVIMPTTLTITGSTTVTGGLTTDLDLTYNPTNASQKVYWSSSNGSIATVDEDGVVTGVSEGAVTIYAMSFYDHSVLDDHAVTVNAPTDYTVTFDVDGGDSVSSQTVADGQKATLPDPEPGKTDYTFNGWYTADSFFDLFDFDVDVITENTVIYAEFLENFTVTFDSNDGTPTSSTQEVADGQKAVAAAPTKDGFTLEGWYTDDVTFADKFDFNVDTIIADITLYAKWVVASSGTTETVFFGDTDTGASYVNAAKFTILWNDRAPSNLDISESNITSIAKFYIYSTLGDNDGKNIKVGSSTAGGASLTIEFSNITISNVTIDAKVYGSDTNVKMVVNGTESEVLTSTRTDYSFDISGSTLTISNIGKRFYIYGITFTYTVNP